ncbi:MAG: phosphoglycerate kinase [Bacteroidetes bacterium]|nr:phosphoglycerate kinase [Bacteroidota bacterium]
MKLTIDDLQLKGKKVLVRVDFNVPLDENLAITDDRRIVESLPTIKKILAEGGSAILMSHLGRPKEKKDLKYSLKPVQVHLSGLLGQTVHFAEDCIGDDAKALAAALKPGEVLLLENLRFYKMEEGNDPEFAKTLASYGDLYVNDAFGTAHRAHASTEGVTHYFKQNASGYLIAKELKYLGEAVEKPVRPFVAILGGSKISGKIDVIQNLFDKVETIFVGGGMIFTFYKAMGLTVGKSLVEEDKIELAKSLIETAKAKGKTIMLPVDVVVASEFKNEADHKVVKATEIPDGWMGLDIGPETIRQIQDVLSKAKTVVWNGPAGVFEMPNFAKGTFAIAQALADITKGGATTIIGGGDSAAAIAQAGLDDQVSHVSTGGGASLEFLEGKVLPGVAALTEK